MKTDRKKLEVWLEDKQFDPPKDGAGLDGIAIDADGDIYLNILTQFVSGDKTPTGEILQLADAMRDRTGISLLFLHS